MVVDVVKERGEKIEGVAVRPEWPSAREIS